VRILRVVTFTRLQITTMECLVAKHYSVDFLYVNKLAADVHVQLYILLEIQRGHKNCATLIFTIRLASVNQF